MSNVAKVLEGKGRDYLRRVTLEGRTEEETLVREMFKSAEQIFQIEFLIEYIESG